MKSRQGFVSNSSSTSFMVILPEDFKIEDVSDKFDNDAGVLLGIEEFLEHGWADDDLLTHCGEASVYDLVDIFRKYIVADVEGGADSGSSISIIPIEKVRKVIGCCGEHKHEN